MRSESGSPEFSKTRTFSSFAIQNLEAMRLLREFGLLGRSEDERGKKAWTKEGDESRSYRNIAEHSLVVGMTADVLFEKLRAKGFLTDEERATGTKAALIHDLTKREEIEFMKQRGDKDYPTQTEINERRREFFAQHGISEHDIQDYQLTQLASFDTLNIDPESIDVTTSPDALREWTIFYADLSVAHTDLVGPHDRLEEIRQRDVYSQTYANKYREIFGEHEFRQLPNGTKDAAEIMMQRMEKQALTVADQLKKMLELPKDVDLHSYIIEQLKQRYAEHAT